MELRYGINPQQAAEFEGSAVRVLNGQPSYVNMLDALNAWQLVREASRALGRTVAASFKHVSPAGAALSGPSDQVTADLYGMDDVGPVASAYLRARDADPKSSYGDFAAVSAPVDAELAELLSAVVCDGISTAHRNYLAAGGYGFILGDGQLAYGAEVVGDLYYRAQLTREMALSGVYQPIINPGR